MLQTPLWKVFLILAVCVAGIFYAVPTFIQDQDLETYPEWFPRSQVSLGLDLRGGSHILLEVDLMTATKDRLAFIVDEVRKSLRREKIGYLGLSSRGSVITFKLREALDRHKAMKSLHSLGGEYLVETPSEGLFEIRMSEQAQAEFEKNILNQSIEIVNRRINELGTREPNITPR